MCEEERNKRCDLTFDFLEYIARCNRLRRKLCDTPDCGTNKAEVTRYLVYNGFHLQHPARLDVHVHALSSTWSPPEDITGLP